jgi:hypothetical protein
MKVSISYESVPELSDLTTAQKRAVLYYYEFRKPSVQGFRFVEIGFVGLIVLAEIAGFIGGFVYWRTPFWGPLAGALIALAGVMVVGYTMNMFLTIPKFCAFLQTEEAQSFIKSFKATHDA